MVEPQLVDYIKKARDTGQADEQTRALLYKNGWTEAEVGEAFASVNQLQSQQPKQQPQPEAQPQTEPKIQQQPEYQAPELNQAEPAHKGSHLVLKLLVVLIILAIVGGVGYYAVFQTDLLKSLTGISTVSPAPAASTTVQITTTVPPPVSSLATAKIASILQDYDITKLTVYSFSKSGDNVAYCLSAIATGKIDCFLNSQKLDNPYNYKPYWIGASPDGKRIVLLYLDPITKQSFAFENGKEGARYDGTISGPAFSDNSQSFMYIVNGTDKKSFVVLNGNALAKHDKVYGIPALSSDAKYILYGARDGQDLFWVADPVQ